MKRGVEINKVFFDRPHAGTAPKYTMREFLVTKGYKSGHAAKLLQWKYAEPQPLPAMSTRTAVKSQGKLRYNLPDLEAWWSRIEAKRKAKEAKE